MHESISTADAKILMEKAKNGDNEAFGQLYQFYFVPIYRYIAIRIKHHAEIEDLTQTVFIKVYQSLTRFQSTPDKSPLNFFFTVARNVVIDYWKKKKELLVSKPETMFGYLASPEPNPHASLEAQENLADLNAALDYLTEEQKEVIILRFINSLSCREVANIMGKNEAAVRQLQSRAIKALRQHLKK